MRYFFGFLVTILLIIVVILLIFRGGGSKTQVPNTTKALSSYASTSAEVRMTIDGPVKYQGEHKQVRITVDRNNVTYESLKGYDGNVVKMQRYDNTKNAYEVFLKSLAQAGFTSGDTTSGLNDERGYCSQNNRYIFEIIQDGDNIQRYWTSDCGKPKTYLGALGLTLDLFKAQVPDYSTLNATVNL